MYVPLILLLFILSTASLSTLSILLKTVEGRYPFGQYIYFFQTLSKTFFLPFFILLPCSCFLLPCIAIMFRVYGSFYIGSNGSIGDLFSSPLSLFLLKRSCLLVLHLCFSINFVCQCSPLITCLCITNHPV